MSYCCNEHLIDQWNCRKIALYMCVHLLKISSARFLSPINVCCMQSHKGLHAYEISSSASTTPNTPAPWLTINQQFPYLTLSLERALVMTNQKHVVVSWSFDTICKKRVNHDGHHGQCCSRLDFFLAALLLRYSQYLLFFQCGVFLTTLHLVSQLWLSTVLPSIHVCKELAHELLANLLSPRLLCSCIQWLRHYPRIVLSSSFSQPSTSLSRVFWFFLHRFLCILLTSS